MEKDLLIELLEDNVRSYHLTLKINFLQYEN